MKAFINARIYDFHNYIDKGYILFDKKIIDVGDMKQFPGAETVIDCEGCLVMPGLVNCHTHIYSAFARGMRVPFAPKSFTDILEQLWWKLDAQLDKEAIYCSGNAYGVDCLQNGVTTIIDHHASGLYIKGSLETLEEALGNKHGIRGIYCFETSDRFPLRDCIEENLDFAVKSHENAGSMFGMHASMSLSDESLAEISKALGNRPIHIHVAESKDDVQDCRSRYHKTILERLDSFGLLNPGSILAHCCHISAREAALLAERGCYVALNPTSNMNNAVGLPDYRLLKKHGIRCLIGNDGLGANITRDYLNLFFSMKNKLGSTTSFTMDDLAGLIRNGYDYINGSLGIKLGRLEKEYIADMLVVPYAEPTPIDCENILGHLIFGVFDSFKPKQVWMSGKCYVKDYALVDSQIPYMEEVKYAAAEVWERLAMMERGKCDGA